MEKRRPDIAISDVQRALTEICNWKIHKIDRLDSFEDRNFMVKYENAEASQSKEELKAMVKVVHSKNFCEQKMEAVMEHLNNEGFICTSCLSFPDGKWHYHTGKNIILSIWRHVFNLIPHDCCTPCNSILSYLQMMVDMFFGCSHLSPG